MSGDIPEGWAEKPLNDLVDFLDGQRRPIKSADRNHMRGPYPYYGASGIIDWVNDYLFDDDLILLGEDGENILSRNLPLAFAVSGKIWVNNHAHVLRPKAGVDLPFLTQLLEFQDYADLNSGTAQPKLNLQSCKNFKLILPKTLPEQQAIAAALSDADRVVAGLERVIAKKRLIKQGAMQDLLTARRRLPGFLGEWEITSLGSALRRSPSYGINAPAIPRGTGGFAYLRITDIFDDGTVDPSGLPSVRESASVQYLLEEGDIVVARTGASVGKSHLFRDIGEPTIFAGFLIRLCPDETKLLPSFLWQFMQTQNYWDWVRENSARSGQPGVNGQQLRTISLKLPEIEEQQAIATVLSDMDAEIQALESRLAKARAVKEGMMQNLLTGRVRLV